MKLLSKESIIFYSILGAFAGFVVAPFIRSLLDFSFVIEIVITTAIILPMYYFAKKFFVNLKTKYFS
ncbi:MAG: hypothetical protein P8N65_06545 [SAR86 cluster bacterium]|jgi:ABC-type uncharacterized transport system permease subunit|nr:hypothetical protein [SAR86 cluster bacterium]